MGTVQIDGSTPKITVGNATAEDATILFDGNAQDFYIALDDSADDLIIGLGSTVGTTPMLSFTEGKAAAFTGAVSMATTLAVTGIATFTGVPVLPANTIDSAHYVDASIDGAHLSNDVISAQTALAEQPALSDEILLSDGGTIKRLDVSHISNTPMCDVYNNAAQAIADSTNTECVFNVELLDSDGKFASNRFTPTVAGRYFCFVQVGLGGIDDSEYVTVEFKLNGGQISTPYNPPTHYSTATNGNIYATCTSIIKLDADDYVSAFIAHNEGGSQNTFASQNRFCAFRLTGVDDS